MDSVGLSEFEDSLDNPVEWIGPSRATTAQRALVEQIAEHCARRYYEEQMAMMNREVRPCE